MHYTARLLLITTVLGSTPVLATQERQMGGVGITVFDDRNFRGRNATFRDDVPDLRSYGLNDRIESLQTAPGEVWEVCEHDRYRGRCQVFSGVEADLRQRGWGNIISSMRRVRGGGGGGGGIYPPIGPPTIQPPIGNTLTLYAGRNFSGEARSIPGPVANLRQYGFDNRAESLRLPRGQVWELCEDTNFRRCTQVNTDGPDLDGVRLRRRVSSVRPWQQGGGGGWGGDGGGVFPPPVVPPIGGGGPTRVVFYTSTDFRGRSVTLNRPSTNLGSATLLSVQVYGGDTWEVCEQADFRGRCTAVSGNIANIRSLGLPRIRSARPLVR